MCRGDSVDLSVVNPRREKSGVYTVILKNDQGQDQRDIMVNIMGQFNTNKLQAVQYIPYLVITVITDDQARNTGHPVSIICTN